MDSNHLEIVQVQLYLYYTLPLFFLHLKIIFLNGLNDSPSLTWVNLSVIQGSIEVPEKVFHCENARGIN